MTKPSMFVTLALLSASLTVVYPAPAQAAYPGDNGRILFAGDGGFGTWDIHTMNPDGTDIVNLTPGLFIAEHATWSPDGTRIAFSHTQGSPSGCGVGDIYVMNADGSDLTPITTSEFGTTAFDPTWSPDGSEIAFSRAQNDSACSGADLDIWKMNSDGSGQVLLTAGTNDFGPAADQEPAWSPDGDRIAFRSNRHTSDWSDGNQIWTMDPDGSNVTQVTHRPDGTVERNNSPAWSPDGEQIAYQHFLHRPPPGLGSAQIWRINEDGTGPTAVTSSSMFQMNPAWSPDGQRIIFSAQFEEPIDTFNNDIFGINVDGTGQTNITNTGVAKNRPDWQPLVAPPPPPPPTVQNGRIIVSGEAGTGAADLITMNPDGSDRVNLTPGGFDEESPEWSPDGTKIAFSRTTDSPSGCRGGDVYVMDADGSNVTPLTSNEFGVAAYDPTWSPDGTEIAFTREHWNSTCDGGDIDIWKMNSDGSGQVLLTSGGNAFGPALDDQPAWSPDGDRIAFRSDRATADWADSNQIYTMDPDGSNVTQVTRLEFHTFEVNLAPTWSPDGEQIAFERHQISPDPPSTQATSQIYRINEDGTGEAAVTSNGNLANMTPEWSPDGQRILFNTHFEDPPDNFNNDLFMINVDGTDQIRVTHTGTALSSPDWQPLVAPPPPPDPQPETKIAFVSAGPEGSFTEDIWTMNPDGSDRVNLLPGGVSEFYPEWSPDGTKIAFSRSNGSPSGCNTGDIWIMDADGSNVTQVTTNPFGVHAFDPTWSPDGEQLAFSRIDWGGDCNSVTSSGIWTMNADGTNQTFISSDSDDAEPAWSPLGDKIAFMSIRPNQNGDSYLEIYTMNTDGSQVTKLTDTPVFTDPEFNENPAWSPDGSMIAFEHFFGITDAGPEIWIMDATGGNERPVTDNGFVSNIHATWSPDGQQIAFSGFERFGDGENNEIYTINVDGSNQTQITDNAIIDWFPSWQPLVEPPPPALEPPTLTATDPVSPADDNTPRVVGTVAPGTQEVTLYATDNCSGDPVQGTVADFTTGGLEFTVPDNSTTTFSATATDTNGDTSACSSSTITYVEDSTPVDVVVTDCDDPALAELTIVTGNLIIQDVDGCETINLANLVEVAGDLIITGNDDATVINLAALTTVGGNLEISGNTSAGNLDLSSLETVSGNLVLTDNTAAQTINLAALTDVGGNLEINNNLAAGELDLESLATVSGNLEITGNTGAEVINLAALAETSGNLLISNNTSAGDLILPSLEHVGGAVGMSGNTATATVNLAELATVGGDLEILGNGAAGEIDISSLSEAGSVEITNNGAAEVSASLDTVHGDVDIESTGDGTFDPGPASAGGDTTLTTDGYDVVGATTASGTTDIENTRPEATMHVQLPDGAFDAAVGFTITRLAPATLVSIEGVGADDEAALIDPIAAYEFAFDVPTLNADATLSFDIHVDGLDVATRQALLDALDAGTATMATRGDDVGATYQAFPVCTGTEVPAADGCVLIERLDADGNPTTGTPTTVRFSNVVGHFSTWAVVITESIVEPEPNIAEAIERLDTLRQTVDASPLHDALRIDLSNKLRRASNKLQENPPQIGPACLSVTEFIAKVDEKAAFPQSRLDRATADAWIAEAQRIKGLIGC